MVLLHDFCHFVTLIKQNKKNIGSYKAIEIHAPFQLKDNLLFLKVCLSIAILNQISNYIFMVNLV